MVFFFFKQKTAYEIYQCDWSSDVCSSDLISTLLKGLDSVNLRTLQPERSDYERSDICAVPAEIGRASCRERV